MSKTSRKNSKPVPLHGFWHSEDTEEWSYMRDCGGVVTCGKPLGKSGGKTTEIHVLCTREPFHDGPCWWRPTEIERRRNSVDGALSTLARGATIGSIAFLFALTIAAFTMWLQLW